MNATTEAVRSLPTDSIREPGRISVVDIVEMAVFALKGNWLRSVLTALGVIIGIAAVIVMVSVGQGTQAELDRTISNLGSTAACASARARRPRWTTATSPRSAPKCRACSTWPGRSAARCRR